MVDQRKTYGVLSEHSTPIKFKETFHDMSLRSAILYGSNDVTEMDSS